MFMYYVLFLPLLRAYGALLYINPGDNVTLPCFCDSISDKHLSWYKQVAGEQPRVISSFYKHLPDSNLFYNQFKDNKRFSVHAGQGFYHLNISNVQDSDSARYYCGRTSITFTEFDYGIILVLKESSHRTVLLQPASDSVKPGDSVTLNCTVQTGTRDGDHSVYWFKEDSSNSNMGIMYIPTDNSNQCIKSSESESPAQSCVYSLSKRNVSRSDAGTYYCAVASCGEILLGKGTRLDVGATHAFSPGSVWLYMVAVLLVLNLILIGIICKMRRGKYLHPGESQARCSASSTANAEDNQNADKLYYAALSVDLRKRSTKQSDPTWSECVYYSVKQ